MLQVLFNKRGEKVVMIGTLGLFIIGIWLIIVAIWMYLWWEYYFKKKNIIEEEKRTKCSKCGIHKNTLFDKKYWCINCERKELEERILRRL